jgi:phosphoenolpyruvate phosphomutase
MARSRGPLHEKARRLRKKLGEPGTVLVAGAHDAISAKLIELAGFDAVWASGFGISAAQKAIPDANVLTMTENLEIARNMNEAVSLPVIADCDNGYGNAINVIRTAVEYERAGIAAISIEDNIFPKRCSFYPGVRRELVPIEEHVGKIKAAKNAQVSPDFMVIARTEALIAGWGMEEALRRAEAYAKAGADALFVHSKSKKFDELKAFAQAWKGKKIDCPLVITPTIFADTELSDLSAAGYKIVIFANQALRASIRAMREALEMMRKEGRASAADGRIVPLEEVYDLIGVSKLQEDEAQFLPLDGEKTKAIVLAAGFEKGLMPLISDRPKAMLEVKGKTLLERQIEQLNARGIREIVAVRGYRKEKINLPGLRYYDNDNYRKSGELASLFTAKRELFGRLIVLYGDILFDRSILDRLLLAKGDIVLVVDRSWSDHADSFMKEGRGRPDLVLTRNPPRRGRRFLPGEGEDSVLRIGQSLDPASAHGEFIGMVLLSDRGATLLRETYDAVLKRRAAKRFHESPSVHKGKFTDLLQEIIDRGGEVACVDIYKGWMEVDTFEDYRRVWSEVEG